MGLDLHMIKNSKKGFLTVEAAIFLPIFIIGVLTFAYLIKFLSIQERVFHIFSDEARVLCSESLYNPLAAPMFELTLKDRAYEENGDDITEVDINNFFYRYRENGISEMISMDLNYDVKMKLAIPFCQKLPVSESLLFRAFVGMEGNKNPMVFEEMEKEAASSLVWIFPRSGGKYHNDSCIYIKSEPRQMIMTFLIRRNYDPCSLCDSKEISDGCLSYCFKTGESYHTGKCPIVEKYIIPIEKEEAEERGYLPCSKCGGE